MKISYIIFLLQISLYFFLSPLRALAPGSQLWYPGFNIGISTQGYGGIGSKYSGFYSFINPASSAFTENIRFFSSGILSDQEWGGSFGLSAPVNTGGTLYAGSQYLGYDGTSLTHMGYGKKVRSDIAFGIEGLLSIHPKAQQNAIGGGFKLGILWNPSDPLPIKEGWGFADFSFGAVLKTVFYPTGETCFNPSPEMLLQLGIEATIMRYTYARWKFIMDYSLGFVPLSAYRTIHFQTWASIGTTVTIANIWDISIGTILGNHGLGFGSNKLLPYTLGTALGYEWDTFSFKLSYAFGGQKFFEKVDYLHSIGLELGIGPKKSTNVGANLSTKNHLNYTNYFSPNNDLIQDDITFLPTVYGTVDAWRLIILDSRGFLVRSFEGTQNTIDDPFGVSTFFYNYFIPTRSHDIPTSVLWDGTDNNGVLLADGTYYALLSIRHNENEFSTSQTNIIILDNTKPHASLEIKQKYLYLGENPESELYITQSLSVTDPWSAKLIDNTDNKIIAQWFWKKGEAPQTVQWKLSNPKRINVAHGKFSYIVSSYDQAGNFTENKIQDITIETRLRNPKISIPYNKFSPNHDGVFDEITIIPDYGIITGLEKSCLSVYNEAGDKIYQTILIDDLPKTLKWKGIDNNGFPAPEGDYLVTLEQHYNDKQQFHSQAIAVSLDITPPMFSTIFQPKRFSPDNNGTDDVLKIDFSAQDRHNIGEWKIIIKNSNDQILHTFQGKEQEKKLFWNPNNIFSQELIFFEIMIQDELGNTIQAPFYELTIDTLIDLDGFIITKNKAYFEEGLGILSSSMFPYLDEIRNYYTAGDTITILAQSYLAESGDSQFEANKIALSRGNAAKAYLINKGILEQNIELEVQTYNEKNKKKQQQLRLLQIYLNR
ncbi:MAG: gliding motility-associated C-terminal domain-containing protein [Brevinema sp.]